MPLGDGIVPQPEAVQRLKRGREEVTLSVTTQTGTNTKGLLSTKAGVGEGHW